MEYIAAQSAYICVAAGHPDVHAMTGCARTVTPLGHFRE